ncbi:hypothetical protein BASA61_007406 [Batrachochytrium salamandrivorans]|nr:hypothetical protein BASA61_007406 [Batrachochytrium salamandrivorans]
MNGGNAHVSRSAVLNPYCPLPSIQQPRHDDSMGNNLPRNVEYAHQQNHQHNQYHRNTDHHSNLHDHTHYPMDFMHAKASYAADLGLLLLNMKLALVDAFGIFSAKSIGYET